ncbi:MAG: hypothetical protein WCB69_20550, partial [Pseudolabrys sp.]
TSWRRGDKDGLSQFTVGIDYARTSSRKRTKQFENRPCYGLPDGIHRHGCSQFRFRVHRDFYP